MAAREETQFVLRWVEVGRNAFKRVQQGFGQLRGNVQGFNDVMGASMDEFRGMRENMEGISNQGTRLGVQFRDLTHGARGFRMEMLGVMFFGLALQTTFMGLLGPALKVAGIFEIWSTILQVVFLPVALALLPFMIKLMDFLINLPQPVQMAVGVFAVLGVVLGTILFWIGQLALGLGSLILVFGKANVAKALMGLINVAEKLWLGIAGVFSRVGVFLKNLLTKFIPRTFATAVAGWILLVAGFVIAFKKNYGDIATWFEVFWRGIKNIFIGVWDFIVGLIQVVVGIFTGDWERAGRGFRNVWNGLVRFVGGIVQIIISILAMIGIAIWAVGGDIGVAISDGVSTAWDALVDWVERTRKKVFELADDIWQALKDAFSFDFDFDLRWWKNDDTPSTSGAHRDFLWRPGQGAISIASDDTIIGAKDLGRLGGQPVQIINNFNGITDKNMLERMLDERDRRIARDLRRLANPR